MNNPDPLVFKSLYDSCVTVSNCDTGSPLPVWSLKYPVCLYNFLHFFRARLLQPRIFWYVFDTNWNCLRLQLVRFSHWTSYVQFPWPLTCLWLKVHWCDVCCFYSSSVDHGEVFSILQTHVSNRLFSPWTKYVWIQVLIILHIMSK